MTTSTVIARRKGDHQHHVEGKMSKRCFGLPWFLPTTLALTNKTTSVKNTPDAATLTVHARNSSNDPKTSEYMCVCCWVSICLFFALLGFDLLGVVLLPRRCLRTPEKVFANTRKLLRTPSLRHDLGIGSPTRALTNQSLSLPAERLVRSLVR